MEQRKQTEEQVRRSEKSTLELALKTERRAVLVVNTRSRRGKQLYADAKRLLESRGITLDAACSARHAKTMTRVMQEAIAEGQRFIIVGGGDGTLSSVLQHFAYRPVVLGILPLGTANSFARTLGIPVELEAAVDVLVTGKVVDVDIGRIGESYFSTVASVGLAAQVARHMPKRLKKWLGRIAYLLVAAMQLRRFGSFRCTVTANGRQSCFDALEVRVANGGYQGGMLVSEEASAESCDLVVHITKGRSVWTLMKVWAQLTAGVRQDAADMEILRSTHFSIDATPRQYVSIDGEAYIRTPFEVSVARQALLVIVPQENHELE